MRSGMASPVTLTFEYPVTFATKENTLLTVLGTYDAISSRMTTSHNFNHSLVRVLAAETAEAPVGLHSAEGGVVGVEGVVGGVDEVGRDGAAEEKGEDVVVDAVGVVLVKGEQDEGAVVVEARVGEQRGEPELQPVARIADAGVVAVVEHVGGDEEPLGDGGGVDVGGEVVEVAHAGDTGGDVGDGVVEDDGVVFADVVGVRRGGAVQVIRGAPAAGRGLWSGPNIYKYDSSDR